ncbi:spermidine/putrescine ABC transporter membrane protein [Aquisphaera giovannonii]|uniref:Spermidine/putrescine ABC transporter membrane protein n=1 Tax=Aquisphaera giovannonii TaxID=406548 RepID=A0A5B9W158_9BACT|nr:ABC transporter permease subunit [Aquisphaera giovannonii]QEH33690.1 spermidine/putrescine ABC transporter membrane protein [Aquisphaera giovannonii]
MNRLASAAAASCIIAALAALVGLPLAATAFEACGPRRVADFLDASGLSSGARWIRETWPPEPEPASGLSLDPAATARMLDDRGGLPRPARLALESLGLVAATEALALPVGVALALLLFRTDVPFRRTLLGILLIAAFVPLPLHATAWLGAFGNAGRAQLLGSRPLLVGRTGAAVVHAMAALPWVVLIAGLGVRAVEPDLEQSALLDMTTWRVAVLVTLRRSLGAIAASSVAVAVLTSGDMTVTDLLQVRTYAEESYVQFTLGRGPADAAAVAIPPLAILAAAILGLALALERSDPARLAAAFGRVDAWRAGRRSAPAWMLVLLVSNVMLLPLYGMVWRAGRVGGRARLGLPPVWSFEGLAGTLSFAWEESWEPMQTSLWLGSAAASIATALAWGLAWKARDSLAWRITLLATVSLAFATPGPVVGMAIGLAYRWLPVVYDTGLVVIAAQAVRVLPYAIVILWIAIRTLPGELLESAAIDGLAAAGVVAKVAIPLTAKPIVAAWLSTFVLAFGELPATNLIQPPGVSTITGRIWSLLHTGVESHLAGVALITLAVIASSLMGVAAIAWVGRSLRGRLTPRR